MSKAYDAIVVGARCAGSPTAMLLARKGYRVLVVDRATFPSDTVSTHVVQPLGVAALRDGGCSTAWWRPGARRFTPTPSTSARSRSRVRRARRRRRSRTARGGRCSTSCSSTPPPRPAPRSARASPSRRSLIEDGRVVGIKGHSRAARPSTERAASSSAPTAGTRSWPRRCSPSSTTRSRRCSPPTTPTGAACRCDGRFETYIRPHRGFAAAPTHDGLTLIVGGWPHAEFEANKKDVEGNFLKMLELAPEFAERVRGAKREAPFRRRGRAEFLPQAVRPGLGAGRRCRLQQGSDHGAGDHRRLPRRRALRDRARRGVPRRPLVRRRDGASTSARATSTCCRCTSSPASWRTLEPPPPEMQQLLGAVHGNQEAMDGFVADERRDDLAGGVLLAGEHRLAHGR